MIVVSALLRRRCRRRSHATSLATNLGTTKEERSIAVKAVLDKISESILDRVVVDVMKDLVSQCHAEHYLVMAHEIQLDRCIRSSTMKKLYKGCFLASMPCVVVMKPVTPDALVEKSVKACVSLLSRIRHPNLPLLYGVLIDVEHVSIGLIFEWIEGPNLKLFLVNKHIEDDINRTIAMDIAGCMNYLHSQHPPIIHSGLCLTNILVADSKSLPKVKILNAGFSPCFNGTPDEQDSMFIAPEVLSGAA